MSLAVVQSWGTRIPDVLRGRSKTFPARCDGPARLWSAQTHPKQGLLHPLDTRATPCNNIEISPFSPQLTRRNLDDNFKRQDCNGELSASKEPKIVRVRNLCSVQYV